MDIFFWFKEKKVINSKILFSVDCKTKLNQVNCETESSLNCVADLRCANHNQRNIFKLFSLFFTKNGWCTIKCIKKWSAIKCHCHDHRIYLSLSYHQCIKRGSVPNFSGHNFQRYQNLLIYFLIQIYSKDKNPVTIITLRNNLVAFIYEWGHSPLMTRGG